MRSQAYRAFCVFALVVLCGGMALPLATAPMASAKGVPGAPGRRASSPRPGPTTTARTSPGPAASPSPTRPAAPPGAAELRKLHADELGLVPVVMYHRIVAKRRQSLDRTPAELRDDLIRMAKDGYVPVTAADFVNGKIDIPAGTHPVVLTFDDSSPDQLSFDKSGRPTKDSAVGVLLDVARRHPRFRPVATMYVIASAPFQEGGHGLLAHGRRALRWLVAHGFDVGNHTMHHIYFGSASRKEARTEIATAQQRLTDLAGTAPVTLAYPGGIAPKPLGIAAAGSVRGASYRLSGAFLSGANPSPSPYASGFPRYEIPRIRGQLKAKDCDDMCLGSWLDRLKKKGSGRYTSDGDPAHIAYPKRSKVRLSKTFRAQARPY